MKKKWILFLAGRYLITKRKDKSHVAFFLSVGQITVGVMALLTIISVMNGFQQDMIDNRTEVVSYHIRIEPKQGNILSPEVIEKIEQINNVTAVVHCIDDQTIITGLNEKPTHVIIRATDKNVLEIDNSLKEKLDLLGNDFNISEPNTIFLGRVLANTIGAYKDDTVKILTFSGNEYSSVVPVDVEFRVGGTFRGAGPEYDSSLAFISLESGESALQFGTSFWGIKVKNKTRELKVLEELKSLDELTDCRITSWREYNSGFYNALKMEKVMMILLVSLVFIVIAVNINHSLKRSLTERIEELALLKAIGASPNDVRLIFLFEGIVISLIGAVSGLLLGIVLTLNINGFFGVIENVVNFFISLFNGNSDFSIYSPRHFYLIRVPVDIMTSDIVIITLSALIFTIFASYLASYRAATIKPAEVVHYE